MRWRRPWTLYELKVEPYKFPLRRTNFCSASSTKFKYCLDGDFETKTLIAACRNKKCVYNCLFNKPYVTIGPVYNKNWRNSVALNLENESRGLGRLENSEEQYSLRIFNLALITEISLPDSFESREYYFSCTHADKSFFIIPKHTKCMYSNGTCETILIGSNDNGLVPLWWSSSRHVIYSSSVRIIWFTLWKT